ncbi:hypothetical protein J7L00_05430, partial [Candidatus Bathyarchaeota archaeon]|nr:hypothetical protein [Candidatus Bathyarchaeota archaeon]
LPRKKQRQTPIRNRPTRRKPRSKNTRIPRKNEPKNKNIREDTTQKRGKTTKTIKDNPPETFLFLGGKYS